LGIESILCLCYHEAPLETLVRSEVVERGREFLRLPELGTNLGADSPNVLKRVQAGKTVIRRYLMEISVY